MANLIAANLGATFEDPIVAAIRGAGLSGVKSAAIRPCTAFDTDIRQLIQHPPGVLVRFAGLSPSGEAKPAGKPIERKYTVSIEVYVAAVNLRTADASRGSLTVHGITAGILPVLQGYQVPNTTRLLELEDYSEAVLPEELQRIAWLQSWSTMAWIRQTAS